MNSIAPPDALIDTLYSAATDFDQWSVFLEGLCAEFKSVGGVVHYGDLVAKEFSFFALHGIDPNGIPDYTKNLETDPRTPVYLRYPGKALSCELHMPRKAWRASDQYKFFRSIGLSYNLFVSWFTANGSGAAYGIFRGPSDGHFDETDCLRFGAFRVHVERVIRLQRQFAVLEEQKWTALSVLNEMPIGIVVCDARARILFANHLARTVGAERRGMVIRHEELWAETASESIALRALIGDAVAAAADGDQTSRGIALTRGDGRRPLHVRISPIWRNSAQFASMHLSRPVCAVYVTDPDRSVETDAEILQRLFGLTPKEAEVLHLLALGRGVSEAAQAMGVAVSTVRTHLKTLFEKTGASSQAALVQLVTASPAWADAGGDGRVTGRSLPPETP